MGEAVAITGLGFVGAVGGDVSAMRRALAAGESGLKRLSLFESELREFPVGQYGGDLVDDLRTQDLAPSPREIKRLSRGDLLALSASAQALHHAGLAHLPPGAGVYLGQSVCGTLRSETYYVHAWHEAAAGRKQPRGGVADLAVHEAAHSVDAVARAFGASGPCTSFMTACSSGANAIGLAAALVASGRTEVMLAGGADSLSRLTLNGFHALQVMSPEGPRPFDAARKGMSVGEGAGMLLLESLSYARRRGARVLALLAGYGHTCDAHHLTAPHPQGAGAFAAMSLALAQARIAPGDVGFVSAHGTSTLDNDRTEGIAIERLFGPAGVPVSSTMRFFGHSLAASGAMKAVLCVDAFDTGALPLNLGLETPLPEAKLDLIKETRAAHGLRHVLSNSFGFGGNNACLVFSRAEP